MHFFQKLILLFIVISTNGFAYEVGTHQFLSEQAFNRSVLADPNKQLLIDIGLIENVNSPNPIFATSTDIRDQSLVDLIKFGAGFEDDRDRALNHFYDPQNSGRRGILSQASSPEWALEDVGEISGQDFSYLDANNRFKEALISPTLQVRHQNWGRTFQSLGQIIHHIQDMAQPQHVRNDDHCNKWRCLVLYKPSAYEMYTKNNHDKLNAILNSTSYADINLSAINLTKDFWDAENLVNDNGIGIGLAEFTSTNFVSIGTNFTGGIKSGNSITNVQRHENYPLPGTNNLHVTSRSITDIDLLGPPGPSHQLTGDIQFVGTQVTDAYIPLESRINPRASSFSIFDSDLVDYNVDFKGKFTLNRFNYDATHEFLIPRAVAYSAGLIDYFFRGRISSAITVDGDGIEITNTSNGGVANPSSPTTFQASGAFEVYYETNTGEHKPLMSLTNLALESSLPVNGIHTITGLTAALQSITDLGDEGNIIILFDGDIGSERGLAVAITIIEKTEVFLGRFGVQYYGSGSTRGQSREIRFNDKLDTIDRMDFVRMPKNGRFICDGGAIIDLSDTTYSTTVNYNLGSAYAGYISAVILSYDPLRVASYFYYVEFRAKGVNTSFDQVIIRSSNPLPPNYFTYFEDKGILNLEFCNYYGVVQ